MIKGWQALAAVVVVVIATITGFIVLAFLGHSTEEAALVGFVATPLSALIVLLRVDSTANQSQQAQREIVKGISEVKSQTDGTLDAVLGIAAANREDIGRHREGERRADK